MSTKMVATDPKYAVGRSTDVTVASSPASLYYENQFSLLPPSVTPSQGAIQRVDVFNTASVRGLATNYDLVLDLRNNSQTDTMLIPSVTKLFQWVKVYLDDVLVQWIDDTDCAWLSTMRNLVLTTNSKQDYINDWAEYGVDANAFNNGYRPPFNVFLSPGDEGRVTTPMDLMLSNLMHKWDTKLVEKISFEFKWRGNSGTAAENSQFIHNGTANSDIYPSLTVANSYIDQRLQLYTNMSLFHPLNTMYVKPCIKMERQTFTLSREVDGATAADPAKLIIKLADNFSYHKRILGLTLVLKAKYTTFGPTGTPGQCWQPNACGCRILKGGKEQENLLDTHKFTRQSNRFMKSLGARWLPLTDTSDSAILDYTRDQIWWNGCAGNHISFLDRNLADGHADNSYLDKIQLVGGLSNDQSEAYNIELVIKESVPIAGGALGLLPFGDQIDIHMVYTELLGVQHNGDGRKSSIKIFS